MNMRGGGGTLDRVVVNEHETYVNEHETYVRRHVIGGKVRGLAIMTDNDILQTKYMAHIYNGIAIDATSIGDLVHIVINDVWTNMGTSSSDAGMNKETTITINDDSDSRTYGTWTSTIEPDNVTVELDCVVTDNSTDVIISKCGSETTWVNQCSIGYQYGQEVVMCILDMVALPIVRCLAQMNSNMMDRFLLVGTNTM